jgi:hypothetical protein
MNSRMKVTPSQKQAISVQHRRWNQMPRHYKPLEFAQWVLEGKEHFESKGFRFFGFPQTNTITAISPAGLVTIRSVRSYQNEYENEYLSRFQKHNTFENAEGVIA